MCKHMGTLSMKGINYHPLTFPLHFPTHTRTAPRRPFASSSCPPRWTPPAWPATSRRATCRWLPSPPLPPRGVRDGRCACMCTHAFVPYIPLPAHFAPHALSLLTNQAGKPILPPVLSIPGFTHPVQVRVMRSLMVWPILRGGRGGSYVGVAFCICLPQCVRVCTFNLGPQSTNSPTP